MLVHSGNCGCTRHDSVHDSVDRNQKTRLLLTALALIGGFSAIELVVSLSSGSLALLAEAGHMLSDCAALGIALLATWLGRLPASAQAPFGYRRVEILAALLNGLGLMTVALWVGWEAIERLQAPAVEVLALPMLVTAVLGLAVNLFNMALLHDHSHSDLNLKGAFLHVVADALGSLGVIAAAIAVYVLGWTWADSAISLVVAALIFTGAIPLVRQSLDILLETTPADLNVSEIEALLASAPGVIRVENLHLWAIAPDHHRLSAHLVVGLTSAAARDRLLQELQAKLYQRFGLRDTCLQMQSSAPATLSLSPNLALLVAGKGVR